MWNQAENHKVKYGAIHHLWALVFLKRLSSVKVYSVKNERICHSEHCWAIDNQKEPGWMITEIFAQALNHIDSEEIEACKGPLELWQLLRIVPRIKGRRQYQNWHCDKHCTCQKREECSISEHFYKQKRDPAYW